MSTVVPITRRCRNQCAYCAFKRSDSLAVPYATIKGCKNARTKGVREAHYIAGERPDKFPDIRATLNLWGFNSYFDYLYTVCELGFLEGLIPILEAGFLSPSELKKARDVVAVMRIMMDNPAKKMDVKIHGQSPGKSHDVRLQSIEWAGKLGIPVSTGVIVGLNNSKTGLSRVLGDVAALHNKYQHIHEVTIQNFVPHPGTALAKHAAPSHADMIKNVEMALSVLPPDITVTIPVLLNEKLDDFFKAGIRDLGTIPFSNHPVFPLAKPVDFSDVVETIEKSGLRLQQRFPLKYDFIRDGKYSKKLGQVFDSYRYKLKKFEQEKIKDAKK